jgi:hypothetical protein
MNIDPNKLWENEFGDNTNVANDFTGRKIKKSDYRKIGSQFAWDKDHILPLDLNGPDDIKNIQIAHLETNTIKGNNNPFVINHIRYFVKKVKNYEKDDQVANYNYRGKKYFIMIAKDQNNV